MKSECGKCRYWDAGECLRFPPKMVPYPSDNQHPIAYWPTAMYPHVHATDRSCGEYVFDAARGIQSPTTGART